MIKDSSTLHIRIESGKHRLPNWMSKKRQTMFAEMEKQSPFSLPWSHYLQLMRIENADERTFYEIEATRENWSIRTLQRQYNSSYYERLALSRDKDG